MMIQDNFVNPHMALGGMIPSDAALIDPPRTDRWKTQSREDKELKKFKDSRKRRKKEIVKEKLESSDKEFPSRTRKDC
jgi:hypothetical protein